MADLTITATSVVNNGASVGSGIAGETITAGQALYLKSADSRYWKAENDVNTESATVAGISLHGAAAGQPIAFATSGPIVLGATTVKGIYALSAAAGGIAPLADLVSTNRISYVGYATSTAGAFVVAIQNTGVVV
jgi:hypothetical protein